MKKLAALLLLVPAVSLAQGNDGEKLFRQMEDKVMKAKTLKAVVAVEYNQPGVGPGKMTISGQLGEGDLCRVEIRGDAGGKVYILTIVSDGTKAQMEQQGKVKPAPSPKELGKLLRGAHARFGPIGAGWVFKLRPGEPTDIDKTMGVSGFQAGAAEKVNGRDTKVVEYNFELSNTKKSGKVKLWIDAQTMLPAKRVITLDGGEMTETYNEFTVDAKIDPKTFELSK